MNSDQQQQTLDENDRHKADSGIETDYLEEANKSVSFSENVKIFGENDAKEIERTAENPNVEEVNAQSLTSICDEVKGETNANGLEIDANESGMDTVRRRKEGVISDSIDQKSTQEFNLDLKVYEKSAETEELIKSAIIANDFLNNMMDAERLQWVANAMIPQVLKANNYVIKEGEIGNTLYVSAEGLYYEFNPTFG